jgi:3-oxoacyl-[acyl-carrier protein] reductase
VNGLTDPIGGVERLQVRSILVTGGNGGLGLAIARYFLERDGNCRVWLGVRTNRSNAESLAKVFSDRCQLVTLDVGMPDDWSSAVDAILRRDGRLDVLVNNAGNHQDHLLATMPTEAWRSVIQSNLDAVFHGCQAVIMTMMRQRFGRIVNISSLSALMAPLGQSNYAAAKAGVVALTRSLAKEVARSGITVNAILPGYINTDALAEMDAESRKRARADIPMRRFGNPEEVAAAVFFLACQDAAYITGSALKIDGGIH